MKSTEEWCIMFGTWLLQQGCIPAVSVYEETGQDLWETKDGDWLNMPLLYDKFCQHIKENQ